MVNTRLTIKGSDGIRRIREAPMPVLAHILFYSAYATVSLALGLALSRVGGADSAGATLGGLSMFAAFAITHAGLTIAHATTAVKNVEKKLDRKFTGEIEKIRDIQRDLREELGSIGDQVARLDHTIASRPRIEAPAPTPAMEGSLIDQLAARLGQVVDQRLEEVRRVSGPAPAMSSAPKPGPIDIVRDALNENRIELHLQPIVSLPQRRTQFYEASPASRTHPAASSCPANSCRPQIRRALPARSTTCCCSAASRSCASWPSRTVASAFSAICRRARCQTSNSSRNSSNSCASMLICRAR